MQTEAMQKSYLSWMIDALGWGYAIIIPLVGLLSWILVVLVLYRGRGPMAAAALVLLIPAPLLVGLYAAVEGLSSSFVILATATGAPRPAELYAGYAMSLIAPLVGMFASLPAYLTAVVGSCVRSIAIGPASKNAKA